MTDASGVAPDTPSQIETSRYIARLMDMSIPVPGTKFKLGLDGVLGLFPVIGDIVTGLAGGFIILDAIKHKAPPETVGKMAMNLGADVVGGAAVPIAGDLFDIVWKANRKNLSLLEDHLGLPRTYDGTARIETGTRFRPKAAPRPVVFGAAAAAAASPAESGRTDSFMVRSEIAAGEIDLTRRDFVAGRVVRRSETQISSSGGDGLITTTGGYTSGYVKPVTVTSRTRHINEVWFPREDGTEGFVLLDADRFPLQEGQKITLVFASGKRLRDRMPLIVVRNRSMGRTTSYAADRTINSVTGYSLFSRAGGLFRPANLALLAAPLLFLLSFGSSGDQLTVPGVAFMLAGFGALLFAMTSVTRKRDAFLKEAAAFAEDDTIASR